MDSPACHVIYVNRNVGQARLVRPGSDLFAGDWGLDSVRDELQPLLEAFGDVHVCSTGAACLEKLIQLHDRYMIELNPTIVLFDTPQDDYLHENCSSSQSTSPTFDSSSYPEIHAPDEELYGLNLLQKLITEAHLRNIAKLVVPIPIISRSQADQASATMTDGALEQYAPPLKSIAANRGIIRKCLDLGAVDVIISPLSSKCMKTLEVCILRALRDTAREQKALREIKKGRQLSWVGINEEKPFAYIREAMVSGLMKRICRPGSENEQLPSVHIAVSSERQAEIADAVAHWHFSAHAYSEDELVVAAMIMLRHALRMPELEKWRIPADQMISFLVACRAAYNNFVPYHNFRHVVDVLQATFNFLVNLSAIAPYPASRNAPLSPNPEKSPLASLITPFEALTLLITAIGHDVGHPGVNNGMLVRLNAPLAQLYNDKSVLEAFHCAAYSQILRQYWTAAFEDADMRKLMISSILATDMGLHFEFIKRLGDVQAKLQENNSTDGWNGREIEDKKELACALLIKCADISNVARRHDAALQWMKILNEEFYRQASMENELEIPTSLMFIPKKDLLSQAKGQIGFLNFLAIPLFQGVADIMPAMNYTVEELEINKTFFEGKIAEEEAKLLQDDSVRKRLLHEGTFSPRTISVAVGMKDSVEEPTSQNDNRAGMSVGRMTEKQCIATTSPENSKERMEESLDPGPSQRSIMSVIIPSTKEEHKTNGQVPSCEAARQFSNSDPFNAQGGRTTDDSPINQGRQRCSETTEGSASGCIAGDWASQATSAATGKIPMSPSTKGTSIISKESGERPRSAPAPEVTHRPLRELTPTWRRKGGMEGQASTPNSRNGGLDDQRSAPTSKNGIIDEQASSSATRSLGKAEGKALRKKSSRFRMRDFPFFRRHKTTDTAG